MMGPGRKTRGRAATPFRERLLDPTPLLAVELRPPRRDLEGVRAMEAWIDVYHSVRGLAASDTLVFLTDNAVGASEEENLGHLHRNLGPDAERDRIVPILTLKHPLEYCLWYAERARHAGFPALVVLGGDRHDAVPRCLPHASMLRARLRHEHPGLPLGGWVNPYREPAEQISYLLEEGEGLDFALTQVVSHHRLGPVESFLEEARRRGLDLPLFAGIFFYRSANPRTLKWLGEFIPVPEGELQRDFGDRGLSAEDVAAESVRRLREIGFTRFYLSNLETGRAAQRLASISARAALPPSGPGGDAGRAGRRG